MKTWPRIAGAANVELRVAHARTWILIGTIAADAIMIHAAEGPATVTIFLIAWVALTAAITRAVARRVRVGKLLPVIRVLGVAGEMARHLVAMKAMRDVCAATVDGAGGQAIVVPDVKLPMLPTAVPPT